MPKVYLTRASKRDDERRRAYDKLRTLIHRYRFEQEWSILETYQALGMSNSTFYSRDADPNKWKLGELVNVVDTLKIPYEEISPILEVLLK